MAVPSMILNHNNDKNPKKTMAYNLNKWRKLESSLGELAYIEYSANTYYERMMLPNRILSRAFENFGKNFPM